MVSFSLALAITAMAFFDRNKEDGKQSHLDARAFILTGLVDAWIISIVVNSKMVMALVGGG